MEYVTVLHLQSKRIGNVVGYHAGRKFYEVQLPDGHFEKWTLDSIKGITQMTANHILIKVNGPKGNGWHSVERVFKTVEEACEYLTELNRLSELKAYDKKNMVAELTNGWTVYSNYDIKEILKKAPPKKELWQWYPFDPIKRRHASSLSVRTGQKVPGEEGSTTLPLGVEKKKKAGPVVKIQDLTKEPKKARAVLRKLVRSKKIVKSSRWEWEPNSAELQIVKDALVKAKLAK